MGRRATTTHRRAGVRRVAVAALVLLVALGTAACDSGNPQFAAGDCVRIEPARPRADGRGIAAQLEAASCQGSSTTSGSTSSVFTVKSVVKDVDATCTKVAGSKPVRVVAESDGVTYCLLRGDHPSP